MLKIYPSRDDHVTFKGGKNEVIKFIGLFILLNLELSMSLHSCQDRFSTLCVDIGTKSFSILSNFFDLEGFRTRKDSVQYPNQYGSFSEYEFRSEII